MPPLFADNFDCQTLDDLVHGVIENDLIDSTLYMHDVEEYYAARISDPMTYLAVSKVKRLKIYSTRVELLDLSQVRF